jgi:hypothetical protein
MDPIYVGDCSIEEVPGSKITYPRGEAAKLVRVFEGSAGDLASFLGQYPILSNDTDIPGMVLEDIDVDYAGPEVRCRLTYYGLPGGPSTVPDDYQTEAEWHPRSVQLATDNPSDGELIVNYYSPIITYKYCRADALDTPLYEDYSENPDTITVLDYSPATNPAPSSPLSSGYVVQGNFLYQIYSVCTSFKRSQKGNIYNYQETWSVLLQKPAGSGTLGNAPRKLNVDAASIPAVQ